MITLTQRFTLLAREILIGENSLYTNFTHCTAMYDVHNCNALITKYQLAPILNVDAERVNCTRSIYRVQNEAQCRF